MLKLSPTSLNLFLDCPRCFWLQINKNIKRPGPPVATITSGLDRVIKEYFNLCRQRNILPSFLEGKIMGKLSPNFPKNGWFEFMDKKLETKLGGYLDECIQFKDNSYAVLDHKTRGSAPETTHKAYQLQMDAYTFLLEKNNLLTPKKAYLVYYIPEKITPGEYFQFNALIKEIATDPNRAEKIFYQAIEILKAPIPAINQNCEFCKWIATADIK